MPQVDYASVPVTSREIFDSINDVTIAVSSNKLCKTVYGDGRPDKPYDQATYFQWFNCEVQNLHDIAGLLRWLSKCQHSCLIRGVPKDHRKPSRRIFRNDSEHGPATIIERPLHWFAIDIDKVTNATGNLRVDAKRLLWMLGLEGTECVVIPTANYRIKSEVRLRLFLWNNERIGYRALKRYFQKHNEIVDLSQFHPIQPIYTARPTFVGRNDPCDQLLAHIPGTQFTYIEDVKETDRSRMDEEQYTVPIAEKSLRKVCRQLEYVQEGQRHDELFKAAVFIGKLVAQELLEQETALMMIEDRVNYFWGGDLKRNKQTILDGFKYGERAMLGEKQ
jgi:hypothetical protein